MLINAEGLVLRQRKIANNRRMIVIFTRRYGKISCGTSLNEKGRSRSALALRPFTLAEYDIYKGRDSYSINSASVRKSYFSIGEDYNRFMTASMFLNYLDKVLQDGEPVPALYDLAAEFMESVSRASSGAETLLYAFVVRSFRMLGVMPELGCCVNCGKAIDQFGLDENGHTPGRFRKFSVTSGGIICEDCAEIEKSGGSSLIYNEPFDIIDVFRFFISRPLSTFEKVMLKKEVSDAIGRILSDYSDRYLGVRLTDAITE